jgi:hypothetical protein
VVLPRENGDWPPSRRSGALARRVGGKVAKTRRLESLRYIIIRNALRNGFAAARRPAETWNPTGENDFHEETFAFFTTCATFSGN